MRVVSNKLFAESLQDEFESCKSKMCGILELQSCTCMM